MRSELREYFVTRLESSEMSDYRNWTDYSISLPSCGGIYRRQGAVGHLNSSMELHMCAEALEGVKLAAQVESSLYQH